MSNDEATITQQELADAMRRLWSVRISYFDKSTIPGYAARLVSDVKNHREPDYESGEYYRDADGVTYRLVSGPGKIWHKSDAGGGYVTFEAPKRPLRKLVPYDTNLPAPVDEPADEATEATHVQAPKHPPHLGGTPLAPGEFRFWHVTAETINDIINDGGMYAAGIEWGYAGFRKTASLTMAITWEGNEIEVQFGDLLIVNRFNGVGSSLTRFRQGEGQTVTVSNPPPFDPYF